MLNIVKTLVLTVFVFSIVISANPAEEAVKKVLDSYVSSIDDQNLSALNDLLMEDASFVVMNKITNKMDRYKTEEFVQLVKKGKFGGWKRTYEITSLYVTEDMAIVRLTISDAKLKQSESLTLLNVNGSWKVSSSTFTIEKNK